MINRTKLIVTPVGAAGSATANETTSVKINGKFLALHCNFGAVHANTDTTVATTNAPTTTILTLTDTNTDGWYYPRHQVHGATGTALTLDGTRLMVEPLYIDDYVKITLAQSTAVACTFTIVFDDLEG